MDAISYSYADKQAKRIKKFINDPDSTSGVLTVPKVIASGESVTIPAGRVAVLPDLQVDGDLVVDGDLFIPTGSMTSQVVQKVASTDNAIVRFDGVTGQVQDSSILIDDNGNLNITGVGKRITGDFSNATANSRVAFQTSTIDGNTIVTAKPNGAGTQGMFICESTSDANNCQTMNIHASTLDTKIVSAARGTAAYVPMMFLTGGSERMRIDTNGNVGIGTSSPTNNLHISSATESVVKLQNTGAGGCWLRFDPVSAGYIWGYTNTPIVFGTNNSERARFTPNGDFLLTSGTGGLGYGTGAGGTVTQLTSKSATVTLNKPTGVINTHSSSIAGNSRVQFIVYNNLLVDSYFTVDCVLLGYSVDTYRYECNVMHIQTGSFVITLENKSASAYSDTLQIQFNIKKGAFA